MTQPQTSNALPASVLALPREVMRTAGAWLVIAAVASLLRLAHSALTGRPTALATATADVGLIALWAIATPLVLRSSRRFPVRDRHAIRHALAHLVIGTTFIIATNIAIRLSLLPDVRALATSTALGLATYYPAAIVSYGVLVALGHVVFSPADVTTPTEPEHEIDRLVIREWNRVRFIPLDDIEWIEAANNHVVVHTPVRAYKTRERMSDVEARLDARRFIRVHRSALVSVAGIREVQPLVRGDQAIILKSGGVVRVARSRRQALADVLGVSL